MKITIPSPHSLNFFEEKMQLFGAQLEVKLCKKLSKFQNIQATVLVLGTFPLGVLFFWRPKRLPSKRSQQKHHTNLTNFSVPLDHPTFPLDRSLSASNFLNICPIRAQSQFLGSNHYVALGWLYWQVDVFQVRKNRGKGGTLFFVLFRLYFMDFCWSLHVQLKLYQSHCLFIFVSLNCIYSALIIGNSPTQWT